MASPRLRPAFLIFILASGSILGFVAGAQEMQLQRAFPNSGGAAAWSPDGTMLATASGKNVSVLNVADGSILWHLEGHASQVSSISWSPDGTRLASGASDRTVRIWDVSAKTDLLNINLPDAVRSVAWSADGRLIAAAHDNVVTVWDVASSAKAAD